MKKITVLITLSLLSSLASSVEPRTAHTFVLSEGEQPPIATLEDASWLVGSWEGTAFGSTFEEIWSPASAGSMVGLFKLINPANEVQFYEILTLTVDQGRLSLKVKHFSADFTAWEDKEEFVDFKLVAVEQDALHFAGMSFYRVDENSIDGYIVMRTADGVVEEKLAYRRAR